MHNNSGFNTSSPSHRPYTFTSALSKESSAEFDNNNNKNYNNNNNNGQIKGWEWVDERPLIKKVSRTTCW